MDHLKILIKKELKEGYLNNKKKILLHLLITFSILIYASYYTFSFLKESYITFSFDFLTFFLSIFFIFFLSIPLLIFHFNEDKKNFEVYFVLNYNIFMIWLSKMLTIFIFIYPSYLFYIFLDFFILKKITINFFSIFNFLFLYPWMGFALIASGGTLYIVFNDVRFLTILILFPFSLFFIFTKNIITTLEKLNMSKFLFTIFSLLFFILLLLFNILVLSNLNKEKMIIK